MREDWIDCTFGDIINFKNGFAFKSQNYQSCGIPIIRIGDIQQNEISVENVVFVEKGDLYEDYVIKNGDILIAMSGATTGKFGRYTFKEIAYQNQRVGNIFPKDVRFVNKSFVFYLLHSLKRKIEQDAYGGAQPNISSKKIEELRIFLPPLSEQRAIIKKAEQLFSALDASIADLKKAQGQLKIYRQAVLKKAFEKNSIYKRIDEIGKVETGATPKRGENKYWQQGVIPWITSGALNHDFVFECNEYITNIALKETNCKLIRSGALLIAMYGEGKTRGKCSELKIDAATNQAIASISIFEEYLWSKKYVKLFLQKNYEDIRLLSSGGVQPNLNLSIIKSTIIPFPNQEIQHQIVKEIESRLSVCDAVEEQIKVSLDKAEALRQSILKKAFAGALLTQAELEACRKEPDYEPASMLLEKIKAEKQNGKKKTEKEKAILPAKPTVLAIEKISTDIQAGLISKVIRLHEENPQHHTLLTHIKCEKLSHLVEYHLQIPLGRQPVKDAAGPDDYPRLKKVEHRAKMAGYFSIQKNKIGHTYVSGKGIGKAITQFEKNLSEEQKQRVDQLLHLFLTFDLEQAEIVATIYAAWNNLLILGKNKPTDQEIVQEARYNWSDRKLGLEEHRFYKAIEWMQKDTVNLVPTGYGTLVDFPKNKK
ncbi:restriction endonuclease subunit S [Elizabethkingia anophelis]|uniref:restriction endonuclease subunit S n=1 Tax=Elizabethkingia anophelis TaxID=1117645 RepID=UPI0021A46397|nr:restriction endonuclease subunit S [Elizabethkingia anophelis]MCT4061647.1 restriction endonuclease subunit S [Elizabethkingia anophelis]MCT4107797.1 restriction endonuclease subunit S [Elizabethkingia anophelis]